LGIAGEDPVRSTPEDLLLGRLAVEKSLIPAETLEECLREQAAARAGGQDPSLGDLLEKRRLLSSRTIEELLQEHHRRLRGLPDLPRYEIQSFLGEGAMGIVYRAMDRELQRPVALKVMRESLGSLEVAQRRFRREAQTAAGLAHPNVVTA